MTSYPRTEEGRPWEEILPVRKWLYQTPEQILIKASNGASDFGNKFGQPLICGSVLTFEHKEKDEVYGYDKVIMLAGGVGYGTQRDCLKGTPEAGNKVVVIGGDNYRIGLGGGSVSSVDTGRYSSGIELNAVQRANAEMQKRAYNVVRALCEEETNPVVSIHDHGSAGHVNCLSELVEECGGLIDMSKLPIGDTTLSAKEIIAKMYQGDEAEKDRNKVWNISDITDSDVEKVICSGIPVNKMGNLKKMSASILAKHFSQKRFSRQRINSIMNHKFPVERFDLITLEFFIVSQEMQDDDPYNRYHHFLEEIQKILHKCGMSEIYIVNPYECFLLMCLLTDCPLAVFADIWEMSYEDKDGENL